MTKSEKQYMSYQLGYWTVLVERYPDLVKFANDPGARRFPGLFAFRGLREKDIDHNFFNNGQADAMNPSIRNTIKG
jgi:hypothetical protein